MRHVCQEITLSLVGCICSILLKLEHLTFVCGLLFLELHLLHLFVVFLLIPVSHIIDRGDHQEYQGADHYDDHTLASYFRIQIMITHDKYRIPVICNPVDIDRARFSFPCIRKASRISLLNCIQKLTATFRITYIGALFGFIPVSYKHTVRTDHKTISLTVKGKFSHHRLYTLKLDIKCDNALSVRQHSTD